MRIILKYILRNIRKNRFSGLLIVISLILCTAVIYLNLNINLDMENVSEEMFSGFFGGYDLSVSSKDGSGINPADPAFDGTEVFPVQYRDFVYGENTAVALIEADWSMAESKNMIKTSGGSLAAGTSGAAITEKKAARFMLSLGDTIEISDGRITKRYTITAICSTIGMFTDERTDCIELLAPPGGDWQANCVFVDTDGNAEAEARLSAQPEWTVGKLEGGWDAQGKTRSIRYILYMVLAMSAIMSFYIISSVSALMLDARMPVIGTFRSVGASRAKMNLLLIAENAVYGVVGGALGIALGELMRYMLVVIYYKSGGAVHRVIPGYVLLSIGFSLALQTGITIYTAARSGRRSIREIIIRTSAVAVEPSSAGPICGALLLSGGAALHLTNSGYLFYQNLAALALVIIGSALLIPFLLRILSGFFARLAMKRRCGPLFLAFRGLSASKISISSVILTAMVIALCLVILLCTASVSTYFDAYEKNYPYDVFVKGLALERDSYRFIDDMDGVESTVVEYWDYREAELNGKKTKVCFVKSGGYSNGITFNKAGAEEALEDGHALVDELFAKRSGIAIGSKVCFSAPNDDFGDFSLYIDGYCDSGVFNSKRTTFILTENDYFAHVEKCPALIGVCLADGTDIDEFISGLSIDIFVKTGENASVYSKETYLSRELENTKNALAIFSTVPVLAALLAVLGLINNQMLSYSRKRREYAVLYSVAMNRAQLGRLVFYELVLSFVFGTVCGCALGAGLMSIVRDIIFGLIAYVDISVDVLQILLILSGAFAVSCVSGLIPKRMVSKMNIVEEIQYD